MNRQYLLYFLLLTGMIIFSVSCKKDNAVGERSFYGKWESSYGDTITFSKENGKNIIGYNNSMTPLLPMSLKYEYTYRNDKLGIKDGLSGLGDFRVFQSFAWIQAGKSYNQF